jgi:hypothetical protein
MPDGPVRSLSLASLFHTLTVADVVALVTDRRREDLMLDFKQAPKAFDTRDERKLLAAAVSGFANSAGGLIVWGVDARKGEDDVDCAQGAVPITDPGLFMSRLTSYAGSAVSPAADGVEHRLLEGTNGPFAVTHVPESVNGPHMAKLGEDRYYKRSGDRFAKMEHFDVADMFGRRPKPALRLELELESDQAILVTLLNDGRGIARAPYLCLRPLADLRPCPYGFDGNGALGLRAWGKDHAGWCFFGGDAGPVIHSGQRRPITKLRSGTAFTTGGRGPRGVVAIEYQLAAEDIPVSQGTAEIDLGE